MRHRLYVHLVWTTRDRGRVITAPMAQFLADYLPAVLAQERGALVALGIVRSHVHVLAAVHPETRIPRLVQRLKGGSSCLAGRDAAVRILVRWAKGYSIESVSPRAVAAAARYVRDQAAHHPDEAIEGWEGPRLQPQRRAGALSPWAASEYEPGLSGPWAASEYEPGALSPMSSLMGA